MLTGGANGIGAATVRLLHSAGANVIFGDISASAGKAVVDSISSPNIIFIPTDVTRYVDNLDLFKTALEKYGRVDHAIACAGVVEIGKWFDPTLTIETVEKEESRATLDVNLVGTMMFARIAVVYLRHGKKDGEDKSLTLLSSAAGFRESPGLPIYQVWNLDYNVSWVDFGTLCSCLAKELSDRSTIFICKDLIADPRNIGVVLQARRDGPNAHAPQTIDPRHRIRVNAVCPGVTDTHMTVTIIPLYRSAGLEFNVPEDVAKIVVGLGTEPGMNGKTIYIEGARGWEIEEGIDRTMPQWLGEEPTARLREGLKLVGTVCFAQVYFPDYIGGLLRSWVC